MRAGAPLAGAIAVAMALVPMGGATHAADIPAGATGMFNGSPPPVRASQSQDGPPFNLVGKRMRAVVTASNSMGSCALPRARPCGCTAVAAAAHFAGTRSAFGATSWS